MSFKNFVKPIVLESLNANTLGGGYVVINQLGLEQACIKVIITNNSTATITISWDGVHAHDLLFPEQYRELSFLFYDATGLRTPEVKKGQIFYASAAAPGVGSINLTGYYVEAQ